MAWDLATLDSLSFHSLSVAWLPLSWTSLDWDLLVEGFGGPLGGSLVVLVAGGCGVVDELADWIPHILETRLRRPSVSFLSERPPWTVPFPIWTFPLPHLLILYPQPPLFWLFRRYLRNRRTVCPRNTLDRKPSSLAFRRYMDLLGSAPRSCRYPLFGARLRPPLYFRHISRTVAPFPIALGAFESPRSRLSGAMHVHGIPLTGTVVIANSLTTSPSSLFLQPITSLSPLWTLDGSYLGLGVASSAFGLLISPIFLVDL